MDETITQLIARLEGLASLQPGERVRVIRSDRTGVLVSRRKPARDGWNVRWDNPVFGCEVSRVATSNLERVPPE